MNKLEYKILNENKQQLNEIVPLIIWGLAAAGTAILGGSLAYNAVTKSHEDQKMVKTDKGFFEPEMYVGENFRITYFNGNEDVWDLMNVPDLEKSSGFKGYSDEYGYYIKLNGSSSSSETDLRVYLPKKEWFDQFKGKIRTIQDAANDSQGKSNTYGLCFYLKSPKDAIKTKIIKPDGTEYFGPPQNYFDPESNSYLDDPSRGWSVLETYKMSGYFSLKGDVLNDATPVAQQNENNIKTNNKNKFNLNEIGAGGEGDQFMAGGRYDPNVMAIRAKAEEDKKLSGLQQKLNSLVSNPPSGLQEYQWATYGEKYGRSEFDRWYDSSSGTWITIGMQICAAIAFAPLAEGLAAMTATRAAYSATYWSITIGSELLLGAWESYYLYNRGMTGQAALVLFCCFLPIFTEGAMFGKLIGRPPGYDDAVKDLVYKFYKGEFRSPSDFKNWMKSLDPGLREELQINMTIAAQYYSKVGTKNIQDATIKAMKKSIESIKVSGIKTSSDFFEAAFEAQEKFISGKLGLRKISIEAEKLLKSQGKEFGIQAGKNQLSKSLGLNLLLVGGGLMPLCVFVIKDDPEFIKDPQKILNGAENTIASFRTMGPKSTSLLEKKITNLAEKIKNLSEKGELESAFNYSKEYFTLIKELDGIQKNPDNWANLKKYHEYIEFWKTVVIDELRNNYHVAHNNGEIEKANEYRKKINKINPSKESFNKLIEDLMRAPASYLKLQNGYVDENGKNYTLKSDDVFNFINWFCGYDIKNKLKTQNSYQQRNNISFVAEYSYFNDYKKTEVKYSVVINHNKLLKYIDDVIKDSEQNGFWNLYDMNSEIYMGNSYFIRKMFTDYYDDYLRESAGSFAPTTTTSTTIKK